MHITARSFSLVGTETHALDELLRRRNKRVGLRMSDQEPHSTFINELERPKKAALLKKKSTKWCRKNARVQGNKLENYHIFCQRGL